MSKYFSERYASLKPYVPGEQPRDRQYVKLNTNESPFPPCEDALRYAREHARSYELYSDPEAVELRQALAERYQVKPENVMVSSGSDEMLNFAFVAFGSDARPALFPDITYGFYRVYAEINRIPFTEIPLEDDLTIRLDRYAGRKAVTDQTVRQYPGGADLLQVPLPGGSAAGLLRRLPAADRGPADGALLPEPL